MKFPERGTGFHVWYEEMFKEEMTMTYSEIYKEVAHGDSFMLKEIVKMFLGEREEKDKKMFKSIVNYTILDEE